MIEIVMTQDKAREEVNQVIEIIDKLIGGNDEII